MNRAWTSRHSEYAIAGVHLRTTHSHRAPRCSLVAEDSHPRRKGTKKAKKDTTNRLVMRFQPDGQTGGGTHFMANGNLSSPVTATTNGSCAVELVCMTWPARAEKGYHQVRSAVDGVSVGQDACVLSLDQDVCVFY